MATYIITHTDDERVTGNHHLIWDDFSFSPQKGTIEFED